MFFKKFLRTLNQLAIINPQKRINLFATLLVNFGSLPFKDAIKFPILIYGKCYVYCLTGKISFTCPVKRGLVLIGVSDAVRSFDKKTVLKVLGDIVINGPVILRRGLHLQVNPKAKFLLGPNVFVSDNATIICSESISILDNARIGNDCTIMDTDFHYIINIQSKEVRPTSKPVVIGRNNWIAGFNVVKKGAMLPDGTIVAGPFSMVGKNYLESIRENSIIGGCPAKLIAENYRRIVNPKVQGMLHSYFKENNVPFVFPDDLNIDDICNDKADCE